MTLILCFVRGRQLSEYTSRVSEFHTITCSYAPLSRSAVRSHLTRHTEAVIALLSDTTPLGLARAAAQHSNSSARTHTQLQHSTTTATTTATATVLLPPLNAL